MSPARTSSEAVASLQQLVEALAAGHAKPIVVLSGEEHFQVEEAVTALKNYYLVAQEDRDFHFEILEGESLTAERLREACEVLPGLLEPSRGARLVLCRRFEKADTSVQHYLETYLADPLTSTALVLTVSKIDKRRGWAKAAQKQGWVLEVAEPYERDWPKWKGYLEKKFRKRIALDAWGVLVELCGRRLGLVASEFEKAALYQSASEIGAEDIWAVAAATAAADIFKFAEATFMGNASDALQRYRSLIHSGESDIKLLAILVRHFRQLRACHQALEEGITDPRVLGPRIGVPPFFVANIVSAARRYSSERLSDTLHRLARADYSLKRGEGTLAELFVYPHLESSSLQRHR